MSEQLPPRRSLESLRKEAKRWLDALRDDDPDARARLERATAQSTANPTLRDVQHALAREHGFDGWTALKEAVERTEAERDGSIPSLEYYEAMANALLEAYRTGTPEAMTAHYRYTWHRRPWTGMRDYIQLDLGKRPEHPGDDVDITLDDARYLVAVEYGFRNWEDLKAFAALAEQGKQHFVAKPIRVTVGSPNDESSRTIVRTRRWDHILAALRQHPAARLDAEGQMTDAMLDDITRIGGLTALNLGNSRRVTDDGARRLARLQGLKRIDLSGTAITDRTLATLAELPELEGINLSMTQVTDAGIAHLARCRRLRDVNLMWTDTGDGALRALAGLSELRRLSTGNHVTDAGIPALHDYPVFKAWKGGDVSVRLLDFRTAPNQLMLRGTFSDRGMHAMRGLDGLFGLSLDSNRVALTAAGMEPLVSLPHLGWLSVDAQDDWMPHIAAMPSLRFLGAQDTAASDDGFAALSKSRSIEYIWGRRCHNLRNRGFVALSTMPALRGLSVSCLNVDDAALASLPDFPALRELMPMDVPDASYRHIGKCSDLESLILMYCRDTTDAATEHITGLRKLLYYFNSYTTITDRTPELLSTMDSLERITFDACHNLTNDGIARLARLPRLRDLRVSGRGLTPDVEDAFPPSVEVRYSE